MLANDAKNALHNNHETRKINHFSDVVTRLFNVTYISTASDAFV